MKTLTAADRSALLRLASELPKGSEERKAILAGLKEASKPIGPDPREVCRAVDKFMSSKLDTKWPAEIEGCIHEQIGRKAWYQFAFTQPEIIPKEDSHQNYKKAEAFMRKTAKLLDTFLSRTYKKFFGPVKFTLEDKGTVLLSFAPLPKGKKADQERIEKRALAKLPPDKADWFRGQLRKFAKMLGGRVVKETSTSFIFTYPKNPSVKRVVFTQTDQDQVLFWIENQVGLQGAMWDHYSRLVRAPSGHVNLKLIFSRDPSTWERNLWRGLENSLLVDLERVFSDKAVVTGISERRSPAPRGWTTNPNYQKATYYDVEGQGLVNQPRVESLIIGWLQANKKHLVPGRTHGGYGTSTENSLYWDPRSNSWVVAHVFAYSGG